MALNTVIGFQNVTLCKDFTPRSLGGGGREGKSTRVLSPKQHFSNSLTASLSIPEVFRMEGCQTTHWLYLPISRTDVTNQSLLPPPKSTDRTQVFVIALWEINQDRRGT